VKFSIDMFLGLSSYLNAFWYVAVTSRTFCISLISMFLINCSDLIVVGERLYIWFSNIFFVLSLPDLGFSNIRCMKFLTCP
jgi:hypothetical protein